MGSKLAALIREDDLYIKFDLNLSELQVICGRLVNDNLAQLVNKGHSNCHLLEKFDIDVSISFCKLNFNKRSVPILGGSGLARDDEHWPPVRVGIFISLLKLNIDDSKIANFYRMMTSLKQTFQEQSVRGSGAAAAGNENANVVFGIESADVSRVVNTSMSAPVRTKTSASIRQSTTVVGSGSSKQPFLRLDLNLSEIDMAVSMSNFDQTKRDETNELAYSGWDFSFKIILNELTIQSISFNHFSTRKIYF